MQNRRWYEWLVTFTFFAMAGLCVYLNLVSRQAQSVENLAVNAGMFILIAIILIRCEACSFGPMNRIIKDLRRASEKIHTDALNTEGFLFDAYKEKQEDLFQEKYLLDRYKEYHYEMSRIAKMSRNDYKCDIEEYFNDDIVDEVMHRNLLNQVAGAMTGLGILGTFIGLSLGLRSFNTGSTAEITNSIAPLMDGIKIAFHTSIYGMIFSLVFNFSFKKKLDEAESEIRNFQNVYKKYVLPDSEADSINTLIEFQERQLRAYSKTAEQIGAALQTILNPHFSKMQQTLSDYTNFASQNQTEALRQIVIAFIKDMNESLGGAFKKLSDLVGMSYDLQNKNAEMMQQLLKALDKNRINDQKILQDERQFLLDSDEYRKSMQESIRVFHTELQAQRELLQNIRRAISDVPKNVDGTFRTINENLIDVETHFRDQLQEMKTANDKLPDVIAQSYLDLQDSCDQLTEAMDGLAATIDEARNGKNRKSFLGR